MFLAKDSIVMVMMVYTIHLLRIPDVLSMVWAFLINYLRL